MQRHLAIHLSHTIPNNTFNNTLFLLLPFGNGIFIHGLLDYNHHFGTVAKWTCGILLFGSFYLQIAFRADGGLATFSDVGLTVEHEADGTFAVGFGAPGVGAFEPGGQPAIADEAADLLGVPFAGWVEAGWGAGCV
jgi:hypothetical protein